MTYLKVLGSGTIVPTKDFNPPGYLLQIAGQKILLDCGFGIIRRLVDYGYSIQDIDHLFISHFHTDHFADAFNLIHARFVDDLQNKRKHRKITISGPKGLKQRFKQWREIFWLEPKEHYPVKFIEGPIKFKTARISIELFLIQHVMWFPSVGIKIKYQNKKIVYTGDVSTDQDFHALTTKCYHADLLIIESSSDSENSLTHFNIQKVDALSKVSLVKKTLVVHVPEKIKRKIEKFCDLEDKLILAEDGMKIKI
ncbi:ribonuclease Z [Patescibacteria group bacterium]|nr:ribonuclease Z [Patescibacteria group bacterium]